MRYAALMVLALAVGGLFRLAETTGEGLFRMFGTLAAALLFAGLSGLMQRRQVEEAILRLERGLAQAAGAVSVLRLPRPFSRRAGFPAAYLVVAPGGLLVIGVSDQPNFGRPAAARRRLEADLQRVVTAVRQVRRDVASWLPRGGQAAAGGAQAPEEAAEATEAAPPLASSAAPTETPLFGMLVLLRRKMGPEDAALAQEEAVALANPEQFPGALNAYRYPPKLAPEVRAQIARRVAEQIGAAPVEHRQEAHPAPTLAARPRGRG